MGGTAAWPTGSNRVMKTQGFVSSATDGITAANGPRPLERRFARLLRRIATTNWILYLAVLVFVGGSLLASLYTGAWHWFQRSGALMVSIGALLSTQRALRVVLDGMAGDAVTRPAARPDPAAPTRDLPELRTCVCGFMLVAFGTLIWAYGDLLGCLLDASLACLAGHVALVR